MKSYYLYQYNQLFNKLKENSVCFVELDAVMMVPKDQGLLNWMLDYCCYQKPKDVQISFNLDQ